MANYQNLKAAISAAIRTNGNQEITGQVLQDVLNSIVSVIGANYTFAGVATPATNPGTPDQNVFYIATQGGTYTNFGATALPEGISLLMWNGSWTAKTIMYNDGGVFDISVYKSTGGTLAKFADLGAALGTNGANIPAAARKGGMSVKFVQSSDNKYVLFRFLLSGSFTAAQFSNTDNWSFCGDDVLVENPEYIEVTTDSEGRILEGTKSDGTKYIATDLQVEGNIINGGIQEQFDTKVDKIIGKSLIDADYASSQEAIESPEWLSVTTDSEGKVLGGRKTDGAYYNLSDSNLKNVFADNGNFDSIEANTVNVKGDLILTDEAKAELEKDVLGLEFFLPDNIYVAVGRTIEIYYDQIVLNSWKYNIATFCNVGYNLDRKYQIIGTANNTGDYPLTISIRNGIKILAQKTTTVHIISDAISTEHNILALGTSITNDKPWLTEIHTLSDKLSIVGKRGIRDLWHEGRSGASISFYNNTMGDAWLYTFDDDYRGTGSDAATFDENTSYQVGDFCKKIITTDRGERTACYRFTSAHQGTWNDADVYNVSMTNPLYDPENQRVSLNYYKSFQNISFDAVILEMGGNGINSSPEINPNGALGFKQLVDNIRQDDATIPIVIVVPMMQSSQNGIGKQGNTDGYSAYNDYKYNSDKQHLDLARATHDMLKDYSNVYFCPMMECHDSKYNFGNNKIQVNPRLIDTTTVYELQPNDSVHPQLSGYMQMADAIFSTLCAIFSN